MARLLALFAGLVAFLLVPLALSAPTALLLPPSHLLLSALVSMGAVTDGLAGRPERARRWGFFYLLATLAMVVSLEVGARVRGEALAYWGVPWVVVAVWGWIPPLVAGGAGMLGSGTERRRVRSAVRRRRRRAAEIDGV
ncbi:MAG: hypothetical protein KC621_27445 [Myxococcales bacterium]|nr:hypothetical protein [Myxococcales bacterium]